MTTVEYKTNIGDGEWFEVAVVCNSKRRFAEVRNSLLHLLLEAEKHLFKNGEEVKDES